jgi:hypothetical protein
VERKVSDRPSALRNSLSALVVHSVQCPSVIAPYETGFSQTLKLVVLAMVVGAFSAMPYGYCTLRMMNPPAEKVICTNFPILTPLKVGPAAAMFEGLLDAGSDDFLPDASFNGIPALSARYEQLAHCRSPDGRNIWLNWMIGFTDTPDLGGYVQITAQAYASRTLR